MGKKAIGELKLLGPYTPLEERAIIEDITAYESYPRPATEGWITEMVANSMPRTKSRISIQSILLMLECFVQITGLELKKDDWQKNQVTFELFLGAINSDKFFNASLHARQRLTTSVVSILSVSGMNVPAKWALSIRPSVMRISSELDKFRRKFCSLDLIEERVGYWMNWPSTNSSGNRTWFDLAIMYERFGADYTHEFYICSASYHALIGPARVPLRKRLPEYMVSHPELTLRARFDQAASQEFWKGLIVYCLETDVPGKQVTTIITEWRNQVSRFFRALVRAGLFVEPVAGFPMPPRHFVAPSDTHVKIINGSSQRLKSVTPFSTVSFSDEEALKKKSEEVSADLNLISQWAETKADQVWCSYKRRVVLAEAGVPSLTETQDVRRGTSKRASDRKALANRAATLRYHGYITSHDYLNHGGPSQKTLLGNDRAGLANQLGMPTLDAMLPFMVLLVMRHSQITDAFLATLELYDKHNSRVGFGKNQSGYFLRGFKRRRGKDKAEQRIQMDADSARIVYRIMCVTSMCRRYLRKKGDDAYRYLFISSGNGFGYPTRFRSIAQRLSTARGQSEQFIADLQEFSGCSLEKAVAIAANFSLTKLRAQIVIANYLKRQDTAEVARALGHVRFSYKLVVRYIPLPLMMFFMERWVRIHQTRFIVEALANSPYRLEASGFETEAELDMFMNNHCIEIDKSGNKFPGESAERQKEMSGATTLIGIDESVMTILCSIALSRKEGMSRKVRPGAEIWVDVAGLIIEHIESLEETRPDLFAYLYCGRKAADVALIDEVVYE
ncbi:hypothetical protein [Burkholderia ubonensis]|uniref:hypothetical protein n=1 Tax=Burkholderia ubonensis TaxID=101571 RepID=UPI000A975BA7|nr:hypothetical protein [Burkholderia ubonensis]